ncbi:MAG: hypothetical protein HY822_16575, partial [Acidobacteria bacterium]|nr:hypothetical protein [Acidobacteriota bacterium]
MIPITTFNCITAALVALSVWLGVKRITGRLDSNWPLAYYFSAVVYLKVFEGSLDPYMVYT